VVTGTTLADLGGIAFIFTASLTRLDTEQKQLCWWGKGGTELDGESDGSEADTGTSQDPYPGLAGGCRGGRVGKLHHTHLLPSSPCLGG